ncbi:MAG: hypothetical protein JOY80_08735 [Candidatus Dormibacteraeota bacterium]|nr:hypothetical protein [Candidatus Dormibacteraeota bacterium]
MTTQVYDAMMDSEVGDWVDQHALMHFSYKDGDGLRIVEIWPDHQSLDEFIAWVVPRAQAHGLKGTWEIVPVHRHLHKDVPHKRSTANQGGTPLSEARVAVASAESEADQTFEGTEGFEDLEPDGQACELVEGGCGNRYGACGSS